MNREPETKDSHPSYHVDHTDPAPGSCLSTAAVPGASYQEPKQQGSRGAPWPWSHLRLVKRVTIRCELNVAMTFLDFVCLV